MFYIFFGVFLLFLNLYLPARVAQRKSMCLGTSGCEQPFKNVLLQQSGYYLNVIPVTFLLLYFLSLKESTCNTRKNVFYFTSKALFVLEKIKL